MLERRLYTPVHYRSERFIKVCILEFANAYRALTGWL
jgi:hypothetical protein